MRIKPISISLSPNTQRDDILLAFRLLLQPWKWKRGEAAVQFEEEFAQSQNVTYAVSFNSGRSAFLALLDSLEFQKGDEIIIQAFTCNAVPNPILWAGLKPVYVDCDETYNIDVADLEKKITSKTKAVLVQHTFGYPAAIHKIKEICDRANILFLEDCAHALGSKYDGKPVGSFGEAAFFSFSRDKMISSVYGGMVTTNNAKIAEHLYSYQKKIGSPSLFWIGQQLFHPLVLNSLILPTYAFWGKYLLVALQKLHLISKAVHWKEKRGEQPAYFPKQLPNALAILAYHQFKKLETFSARRQELVAFYLKKLEAEFKEHSYAYIPNSFILPTDHSYRERVLLRLPVRHPRAHDIIKKAWKQNILLGDWYTSPIAPDDTKASLVGYEEGMALTAEELARTTLNLPTHINISDKDAEAVVSFLKTYGSQRDNK